MLKAEDLYDPSLIFQKRTEEIGQRILTLQKDLKKVKHYYSKAIIEKELEILIDDYVARSFSLQQRENGGETNITSK